MLVDTITGEIFIYDQIGSDFGIDGETMLRALDRMKGKRPLVRINSPGGSLIEGVAIHSALSRYPGGVDTINDSLCASAATLIALAGERRYTAGGSLWMIHEPSVWGYGNVDDIQKLINSLEAGSKSLQSIYKRHLRATESELKTMMLAETWFEDSQAVAIGLATERGDLANGPPTTLSASATAQIIRFPNREAARAKLKAWEQGGRWI